MNKLLRTNIYLRKLLVVISSTLLTVLFFAVSFQTTYNACSIVLLFMLNIKAISYLWSRRKNITKRGVAAATLCAFVLAITSLIGVLTEQDLSYLAGTYIGGMRCLLFLSIHTVLLSIVSLCLFIYLETQSKENKWNKGTMYIVGGGGNRLWCLITLCWMPYCIAHFPGRLGGGSTNQILQFYGQETLARSMSSIIYENHYITNHHPVLLTYFYGIFFKVGNMLGDTNASVFLLSCIILVINSFCIAYLVNTVKKYISQKLYSILVVVICLYPIYGIYSYTICKDNLFASALALFYAFMVELSMGEETRLQNNQYKLKLLIISVLIPFLKNQGLPVVIISLFFAACLIKAMRKYLALVMCTVILIYTVLFSNIMMPILKIAPGGKQEALSVPFQQTALYMSRYKNEITQEEYEIINEILPADQIGDLYQADRADAVKFGYKQDATGGELSDYFLVWGKQFLKHPLVYFEAFFGLTDGYYYVGYDQAILDLYKGVGCGGAATPGWVLAFEEKEEALGEFMIKIPIVGSLFRAAIFMWIIVFTTFYCIYRQKKMWFVALVPVILNFMVCLLSPWNGVIRYVLPLIYALPMYFCILGKKQLET